MIDTPRIVESPAQLVASIPLLVPRTAIRDVMGPAIREVFAAIGAQGLRPAGPWLTHHRCRPTDHFDLDVGVPVVQAVRPVGRVRPGTLPAATVARTEHHGPYEALEAAWGAFVAWIAAHGHVPATNLWESYVTGPESEPDPAAWRTELSQPLVRVAGV